MYTLAYTNITGMYVSFKPYTNNLSKTIHKKLCI